MYNLKSRTLERLLVIDKNEHELKRLAHILIEAIQDWPNPNLVTIGDFVEDMKSYFGDTLDVEKIKHVQFDGQNAWQLETGFKIVEFLIRSKETFNSINFDDILNKVLHYYQTEFEKVDFVASVQLFGFENGGAKSSILNGFKPNLRFEGNNVLACSEFKFDDRDIIYAGQSATINVKLQSNFGYEKTLTQGVCFDIRNLGTVIGKGIVQHVVNVDLEKESWTHSFANSGIFMLI